MLRSYLATARRVARLCRRNQGEGASEYALILALIAVIVIVVMTSLGESIRDALIYARSLFRG